MRHLRLPNQCSNNLARFKQQVGHMVKEMRRLNETDQNAALNYLLQGIGVDRPNETLGQQSHIKQVSHLFKKRVTPSRSTYFKCTICGIRRKSPYHFLNHLETHNGQSKQCANCQRFFNNRNSYKWHLKYLCNGTVKGEYKCAECAKQFRFKRHLTQHLANHRRNNCSYCNRTLTDRKALLRHLFDYHRVRETKRRVACSLCEKSYVKKQSLYYHQQQHFPDKCVCLECGEICDLDDKEHRKSHESTKDWECPKCEEKFIRRQQYLFHLKRHDHYKCISCKQSFGSIKVLLTHKQRGHQVQGLEPRLHCPFCTLSFNRTKSLAQHFKKHDAPFSSIMCKFCDKTFNDVNQYFKHCLNAFHTKETRDNSEQRCHVCDQTFDNESNLREHRNNEHPKRKLFSCEHCQYRTASKVNYERHFKLHFNNEDAFMCEQCGKAFASHATLNDHINYMHQLKKELKCDQCGKLFKRKSEMSRHQDTHSDVRPYMCTCCGMSYKRIAHLRRHELAAHKIRSPSRTVQRFKANGSGEMVPVKLPRNNDKMVEKKMAEETSAYITVEVPVIVAAWHENFDGECNFNNNYDTAVMPVFNGDLFNA